MECDQGHAARPGRRPRRDRQGQSFVCQCGRVDRQDRRSVARSAGTLWQLEQRLSAFNRWCKAGLFQTIMEKLQDPDLGVLLLDSTIIRAHQHAAGAEGSCPQAEALGRSRGGFSTKIHVACDGLGKPVKIILTPGQEHDITQGPALIAGSDAEKIIADRGYDSDAFIADIESRHAEPVIPPRSNRLEERSYDTEEYKKRNVVERFLSVLKQCRRVATRYEKTARNFLAVVALASTFVLLN